jgi:hypothetical protein
MRNRCFFSKRIMMVVLLSALACGCAGKTVVVPSVPPEKILEIISRTINETDRIVATAQIDLMTAQGHYPIRAALILQKPSYLRLEMLPVIGTPDFFLTATPDDMRIFIPSRGEFYSGKPSTENLTRFLPLALNIEDIVMIFSGAYPTLAGKNLSYESYAEASLLRVDRKVPGGGSQIIWMEKNGRMAKLIRNGSDSREIYQVQYEDYEQGSPFAGRITIKMADQVTSISVKYTDIKIEKATDLSIFELPVPAGIKTILLD